MCENLVVVLQRLASCIQHTELLKPLQFKVTIQHGAFIAHSANIL